jgi:hypothetical protein
VSFESYLVTSGAGDLIEANFAYVLVKPDAVLRGIAVDLVEELQESSEGCVVDHADVGVVTDADVELLYGPAFRWDLDSWAVNRRLFSIGPSFAVLLAPASDAGTAPLLDRVRRLKGSALPDWPSGTLRGRFAAWNRAMNLLHVPDDPAALVREASRFFGVGRVRSALTNPRPDKRQARRRALHGALHYKGYDGIPRSGWELVAAVMHRAVAALDRVSRLETTPRSFTAGLAHLLREMSEAIAGADAFVARRQAFLEHGPRIGRCLDDHTRTAADDRAERLIRCLVWLSSRERWDAASAGALVIDLRAAGVHLTALEECLLETTLVYAFACEAAR